VTLRGKRVLVVEDEAMICMMLEEFLGDLGCRVVATASHMQDGRRKAEHMEIDLAVLDINLDGELSYPIAQTLMDRAIPFVFSTGYGRSGVPPTFKNVFVLVKPFGVEELREGLIRAICN